MSRRRAPLSLTLVALTLSALGACGQAARPAGPPLVAAPATVAGEGATPTPSDEPLPALPEGPAPAAAPPVTAAQAAASGPPPAETGGAPAAPAARSAAAPAAPAAAPPAPAAAPPAPAPVPLVARLRGTAGAGQVITVTNDDWSSTYAALQLWQRRADGSWASAGGPWTARIGRNGFGSPKREGDGHSPVGSFGFGAGFGVQGDPGYRFGWRQVDPSDVWVDDPASRLYNTHQRLPASGRWSSAEAMYQPSPYAYAALINYNLSPITPYAGSAIFLHVGTGGATAGCVSLPAGQLLTALRWLDPGQSPRIVMGPVSAL